MICSIILTISNIIFDFTLSVTTNHWTKRDKPNPSEEGRYLVVFKVKGVSFVGIGLWYQNQWSADGIITHWMPMPDLPEE